MGSSTVDKQDSGYLSDDHAKAIARISTLENLREQARQGNREAMLRSIEKMLESELRALKLSRAEKLDGGR
jgi:uncharacterized membrane-anchored protein